MSKVAVIGIVGESVFLSVDEFHKGGETVKASAIHKEFGGKGFNQAIAVARYGVEVSFLGAINREISHPCTSLCEKEGINGVFAIKQEQSPYAVILTDKTGANQVTVYQGAQLTVGDVEQFKHEIESADVLLLNNETPIEVNMLAGKIARARQTKIIYNPAPSRAIPKEMLNVVDLFTPNEYEQVGLEKQENLIVTLGEKGCFIRNENKVIPAEKVQTVVDTTGAGDTFNGVLVACIANGLDLQTACKTANVASAIKVTRKYILNSIPTKKEIENMAGGNHE
jgi:ribokinase